MPQFNLANFMPQLVWLAVFFAILYFGVVRLTLPKLGRVMTAREDQVTGDLSKASAAKGEADRMAADYDASVLAAQDAARAKLGRARVAATTALEARLAASNTALDAKASEAQIALDAAVGKALSQIESIAADAAADIVERVTGRRPAEGEAVMAARASLV